MTCQNDMILTKVIDVKPHLIKREVVVGLILKVSHVLAILTTLSQLVSIGGANDLLSMAVKLIASLKRKEWSVNIHKKFDWGLCTFFKIQNSNFISIHISLSLIINRNCFDSLEIGFCDVKNIDKTDFPCNAI